MTIDWKKETAKLKDDYLADLFSLLEIDSVRKDEEATEEFPVGPGPAKALDHFLKIGERDGFKTENFDNWAGHIEFGEGEETLGIFGHVDVVPVGTGWETDPFKPVIKDGRIYARGASDDKGPSMAAYHALKLIKDMGLPVSKKVRLIIGTDEESGWQCMDHYLKVAEKPDFGFSPDAHFPIINGEKGNVSVHLEFGGDNSGSTRLLNFESGLRANMVPQDAFATVETDLPEEVVTHFNLYLAKNPEVTGEVEMNGRTLEFKLVGKAAHGSTPENGVNGATYLARFLKQLAFQGSAADFINISADILHDDHDGEKLGVSVHDELMGDLSSNPGVFSFNEKGGKITINMRFPQNTSADKITEQITERLSDYQVKVVQAPGSKKPHYVPGDDPLVQTLLDVYHRQTGLPAHEMVIGGGTYGRLLERGVAFGAMFPDSIDTMHQANEFMAIDDLMTAMSIYAEAIYELIK